MDVVSEYSEAPPAEAGRVKISGPIYALERVQRLAETTAAGSTVLVQYFLKFAIDVEGMLLLLVSCHLSN